VGKYVRRSVTCVDQMTTRKDSNHVTISTDTRGSRRRRGARDAERSMRYTVASRLDARCHEAPERRSMSTPRPSAYRSERSRPHAA